jgi:large subunit ribosomal protein L7/L12
MHIFLAIHLIFYIGALILQEEEEVAAPQAVQTSFTVKLHKFDADKKVAIIKEIKNLVEGMNLVQAKKFIESCPAVVKADIAKDEAEKIKAALAAVGGEVTVE